jgi:hopanoid biosynthesis associated protein HpnK
LSARLIVTADDVGLHPGMTGGAIEAHHHGIVTACSVVANGAAFDDAVVRLKECPSLDVGVHLTLVEERPLEPPRAIPSLVDGEGRFFRNFKVFALRYSTGRIRIADVEHELAAQIERALDSGLPITHLNGHQHLHVLPSIFDCVLRLAQLYKVPFVRIPSDRGGRARRAAIAVLNQVASSARHAAREAGVFTSDRTIGIAEAGHFDAALLESLLRHAEGVTELVCHPGVGQQELAGAYDWGYDWEGETAALCDPRLRGAMVAAGVELARIGEVVG